MKNESIGIQFDDDCPATTEADWRGAFVCHNSDELHAEVVRRTRGANKNPLKELVAIRYEADILATFRATGKGWQTRMNDALKEWISEHPDFSQV
ncbi:MAG: BrnA antitoxin family protein [Methylococcaceae bacterium]